MPDLKLQASSSKPLSPSRYVIQCHDYAGLVHYDAMFQVPGRERLRTFQLPDEPSADALAAGINCRETARHRAEYLDYEGEVSRGRGSVAIWDQGVYETLREEPRLIELNLLSSRGMRHPTWLLHFTGGSDWYLVAPNVAGRWALKY